MKPLLIFLIVAVLAALSVYMISARPGLTYDAYTKKCVEVGGVVVIMQHERICVREAEVRKLLV